MAMLRAGSERQDRPLSVVNGSQLGVIQKLRGGIDYHHPIRQVGGPFSHLRWRGCREQLMGGRQRE